MFWWPCPSWPHLGFVHPLLCCFLLGYWFCPARHCYFFSYILSLSCSLAFPCRTILLARSSNFSILLGFFRLFLSPHYCQDWSKVFKNIYLLQFNSVFCSPAPFSILPVRDIHVPRWPLATASLSISFLKRKGLSSEPYEAFLQFQSCLLHLLLSHSCLGISNHFSY